MIGEPPVASVAEAVGAFNAVLRELPARIRGEVSSAGSSQGKFFFFDLKDEGEDSRLNCFMMLRLLPFPVQDGMRVVVSGTPGLHKKYGKFSITVRSIRAEGEGSLQRAFELLKVKLEAEGLFAAGRKRAMPLIPLAVGVVSSPGAAGWGDFKRIAALRLPASKLVLAPSAVQGDAAEREIVAALDRLNERDDLGCIVIVRGGGAAEDLHAFNSEAVARAIVRSRLPVLCGVGHERDVTVADLAADQRAATPSNAAELLFPTSAELAERAAAAPKAVMQALSGYFAAARRHATRAPELLRERLMAVISNRRASVAALLRQMEAVSPAATLARGYALVRTAAGTVRSPSDAPPGTPLTISTAGGELAAITLPA